MLSVNNAMIAGRQTGCVYVVAFICLAVVTLGAVETSALDVNTWSDRCRLKLDEGICRASMHLWFNNFTSGKCEEFIFGGCGGNDNYFYTKEGCEERCKFVPKEACTLKPDEGRCRATIPRWYFNETTWQCKKFQYGGCEGNGNNFLTSRECEQTCRRTKYLKVNNYTNINYTIDCEPQPGKGNCTYASKRFFYNASIEACQPLQNGTCATGRNEYRQKSKCFMACFGHPVNMTAHKLLEDEYNDMEKGDEWQLMTLPPREEN
ncbi:tissue factor pathway inhibitor-like [Ornithodoros turicata]|uniref:tissue factor pathway inhibitor-like n=1 Tax=Ornithodoros turicata TaxID=34597 RepID=UPI00313A28CF